MGERESQAESELWWIQRPITSSLPTHSLHSQEKKKLSQKLAAQLRNWICDFPLCCLCPWLSLLLPSILSASNMVSIPASESPNLFPLLRPWTICGWLWQIKPTRYMAITFTGWHGGKEGNRRGEVWERKRKTPIDGWWDILSIACCF